MKIISMLIALGVLAFPAVASAGTIIATVGGWDIIEEDGGCSISMEFEGPGSSNFVFGHSYEHGIGFILTNGDWTSKKDEIYDIRFEVNNMVYTSKALGITHDYQKGFLTVFDEEFGADLEKDMAAGSNLHVFLGDQLIDRLSLEGTSAALASMKTCYARQKRKAIAAEAEKARWQDLPKNPFADENKAVKPGQTTSPVPRGNPGSWINSGDYPSQSLREHNEGTVSFKLTVGANGRATSCKITESSGYADLDSTTCANITRRARFDPMIDRNGNPVESEWSNQVRWDLPEGIEGDADVSSTTTPPAL